MSRLNALEERIACDQPGCSNSMGDARGGAVIRYQSCGVPEIAHRIHDIFMETTWAVDCVDKEFSDTEILERGAKDGFEVATWTKPENQT